MPVRPEFSVLQTALVAPVSGSAISPHGVQAGGNLHADATTSVAGFMSASDKRALDGLQTNAYITADLTSLAAISGATNGATAWVKSVADNYMLDTVGIHTVDGVCVIAATGGGYWVARNRGRWDDVLGSIASGKSSAALVQEAYRDTPAQLSFFKHNVAEDVTMVFQFPHAWLIDSKVYPHLHFIPMVNPASTQVFHLTGYYAWAEIGGVLPAVASWTALSASANIGTSDAFKHKLVQLVTGGISPPAGAKGSTCLVVYAKRDVGGSDTYTTNKSGATIQANIALLHFDAHYQKQSQGTEAEIP